jgi:ATP-dependent Clp protease protease subunit
MPSTRVVLDRGEWPEVLHERLFEQRIVLVHGHLDDEAATRLCAQLLTLDAGGDDPIQLHINGLDGDLAAVLTVMDALDAVTVPVHARAGGQIRGSALGVLAVAGRRRAHPNAGFQLSEPRMVFEGTATELAGREQQARRMLDTLYFRLADVTRREVDEIRDDARRGRFLTVDEAIAYGLIEAVEGRTPA